jgi:hypothetical protein
MYKILTEWLKLVDGLDLLWALKPLRTLLQKNGEALHQRLQDDKRDYPAKGG